jgi:hypothetical protein
VTENFFDFTADASLEDWLSALPGYQQNVISQMLSDSEPVPVAIAWLNASGQTDTAPFGTVRLGASLFYQKLLEQLQELLCGSSPDYEAERGQLVVGAKAGQAAVVTMVSDTIAPVVGVSPVLLAPAVALTLFVIAKAGRETACEVLSQMIKDLQDASHSPP